MATVLVFRRHFFFVMPVCLGLALFVGAKPLVVLAQSTPEPASSSPCVLEAAAASTPAPAMSDQGARRLSLVVAAETVIACRNAGDWQALAPLIGPGFLERRFGTPEPLGAARVLATMHDNGFLRPLEVQAIGEPSASPAFGTINLTVQEGHVLHRQEWSFSLEDAGWLLSDIVELVPLFETNAVGIPLTLDTSGLSAFRTHLVNPGAVVFDFVNTLDRPAGFAVFQMGSSGGDDIRADLIQGEAADPNAAIGWVEIPAVETGSLALVDLQAGSYLIVAGYDPRIPPMPIDAGAMVQISIEN